VDPEIAAGLRWYLGPFLRRRAEADAVDVRIYIQEEDEGTDPPRLSLFRGHKLIMRTHVRSALLLQVVWDLTTYVPLETRDFLILHAGAVTGGDGTVLLPAPPDTGKSSTVAALLQQGFGYLSDEAAPVDPITGRVYPFPKRLALDQWMVESFPGLENQLNDRVGIMAGSEFHERYVAPEDLGATVGVPSPIRGLVFLSEDREGPARLSDIPRAEAVQRMASNGFNLHVYQERGVILLTRIVTGDVEALRLDGGSPSERAELLAQRYLSS
jgi:hypothetical protein